MAYTLMSLRAVNHRLTNLPVQKLPEIAASLAASISACGELLSAPQSQKTSNTDSDHAVQVHKLVVRLTSLLQDRTCEGRFTAVVLVKALVEAGQWEVLRGSEPFVRGLMGILNKPDPTSTKVMAVITLTRIFHLTYQYPTLVREITTPSLPGFVTSTLNLISTKPSSEPIRRLKPNTPFIEVVLHAYAELIARHPTIFRPFTSQIHSVLQAIVGSTSPVYPQPVLDIAERLFVSLHHCAPRNTSGEEWKNACRMTIASIHATSDHVLRAIVEQWESVDPSLRQQLGSHLDYSQEAGSRGQDPLGLSGWRGLDSGINRLVVLLRMLSTFLKTATASTVFIPIGSILDLTARLMSVTVPSDASDVQTNPEISRTERENLFAELPRIHTACMELLYTLINTLQTGVVPVAQTILEQTLWVFRAEQFSKKVRTSVYSLVQALLEHIGPSMSKKNVSSLTAIIRTCCSDLLPLEGDNNTNEPSSNAKSKSKANMAAVNADSFLNPSLNQGRQTGASTNFPKLNQAASDLLPTVLNNVPTEFLAPSVRAEIDRTIIITSDKNAMYASVLNPLPAVRTRGANISIIPFLARSYSSDMDVEALIRPRMPVLTNATGLGQHVLTDEDEEEDEPMSTTHAIPEATGFLKQSSTPNLQDLMNIDKPQRTSHPNKRNHAEESENQNKNRLASKPAESVPGEVQTKKARFESHVSATPSSSSAADISASSTSGPTPAASVQTSSVKEDVSIVSTSVSGPVSTAAVQTSSVSRVEATSAAPVDEDSDSEMPTLDIEPDTDEEDEDEE